MLGWVAVLVALALIGMMWGGVLGYWGLIPKIVVTVVLLGVAYWGYSKETYVVPSYMPTTTGMLGGRRRRY